MEPCYEFRGMKIHDNPRDIKPKRLKPFLSETTGLYTADISGAQVKESRAKSLRHPRDSISIQDIDGAQANTLKRTIVSSRCSDPVCPTYKSLDGNGILEEPPHKPMIPSHIMATSHTNNAGALAEVNNKSNIITKQITDSNSIASYAATKLPTTSPPILAEPTDLTIASDHSNSNHSAFKDQQSYKPTHAGIFDHYSNLPTCPSLEKVSRVNVFGKNARRSGEFGSIADTPSSTLSASAIQDILKQTTRPHLTSSISNTKPRAMKITSRLQSIESQYTGNSAMSMNSNQRKAYQELRDEVAAVRRLKL